MMKLCELVRGYRTSDETLARARAFAEAVGKTCVVVNRDVAGFVTTRLITVLAVEAAELVETGVATAEDVDTACRLGFGHAMGPLQTADLTGMDILLNAAAQHLRGHRRTRSSSRRRSCSAWWRPATWAARPAGAGTSTDPAADRRPALVGRG